LKQLMTPYIIDIEASGFGPDSFPIEVGAVLAKGQRFSTLIKPLDTWDHWDESAEKVHGIPKETLLKFGKPVQEVAYQLNDLLGGMTLYSDGWVVDKPWLDKLFRAASVKMAFELRALEVVLKEKQMEAWHETKDRILNSQENQRHRASYDAWLIQQTYIETLKL